MRCLVHALVLVLRLAGFVAIASVMFATRVSAADDAGACSPIDDVGPLEVTPASGASTVPTNSVVKVRYSPDYFAPSSGPVPSETIVLLDANDVPIAGSVQVAPPEVLYFVPDQPLPTATLHGFATGPGGSLEFTFQTVPTSDSSAPTLDVPSSIPVTSSSVDTSCDAPFGGRRIGITFPSASDDGPATSLDYYLYLTRGPGVVEPRLLVRERGFQTDSMTLGFVLPPAQLAGPVCVALVVTDGLDKSTSWRAPVCFDPVDGVHFAGLCGALPGRRNAFSDLHVCLLLGGILAAVLCARRRRVDSN